MSHAGTIAADLIAIVVLVFAIYFPRHRHRDMVVAFLSINIGVLAIASVLSTVTASMGLAVGLFGVLSIIRLRSDELNQRQVAYYFASLALGLLGGTRVTDTRATLLLMGLIVGALFVSDHPRLLGRYRVHELTLDRAFADERELTAHLGALLGGKVHGVSIRRVDFVNDTTIAQVRFELPNQAQTARVIAPTPEAIWR